MPGQYYCSTCMVNHADQSECAVLRPQPAMPEPETTDDALVIRLFTLRAYARGLLADLHRAGLKPSPETFALTPPSDSLDP